MNINCIEYTAHAFVLLKMYKEYDTAIYRRGILNRHKSVYKSLRLMSKNPFRFLSTEFL